MVKLSELKKKYAEELKKQREAEKVLNGMHEEIEILVIDIGYTQGGLANLYSLMDGYVSNVDENVKKIEEIIRKGKVAKVKAVRLIGTKRLTEIKEIEEVDDPDVDEDKIWEGEIEYLPPRLRFIRTDGEIYWIDMGSISYERITGMEPGNYPVLLLPALVYTRRGKDGREFKRIKGFHYSLVEEEEEPISTENPPETIEV